MWIELHHHEKVQTTYMINTDNICVIYQGQTGSGQCFVWVEMANGFRIPVYESMNEIFELMRKGVDNG